jgi:hypothetical protein
MGKSLGVRTGVWLRMPHSEDGPPPSLWWYSSLSDSSVQHIIDTYLKRCSRGRVLPPDLEEELSWWLEELSREHKLTRYDMPGTARYWTIPAYALKHGFKRSGFLKRFRELENIAKRLFPDHVPTERVREPLSEERKSAIRKRFLEVRDFKKVADEFGIEPFRVGQLCREEKKKLNEEREKSESTAAPTTQPEFENRDFEKVLF